MGQGSELSSRSRHPVRAISSDPARVCVLMLMEGVEDASCGVRTTCLRPRPFALNSPDVQGWPLASARLLSASFPSQTTHIRPPLTSGDEIARASGVWATGHAQRIYVRRTCVAPGPSKAARFPNVPRPTRGTGKHKRDPWNSPCTMIQQLSRVLWVATSFPDIITLDMFVNVDRD